MRLAWRWLRSYRFLAFIGLAWVALVFTFWPRQRVTEANFLKIKVGMSEADLRVLLGAPKLDEVVFGLVVAPDRFMHCDNNRKEWYDNHFGKQQLLELGYRNYRRQEWTSSEITIVAVFNQQGPLVCWYKGEGEPWDWLEFLQTLKFW